MDDKTYYPEVIADTPLPIQNNADILNSTQSSSNGTYSPQTTQDQRVPTKRIAVELLGQALNTRTKKILQAFEFTPSGAIQVGAYTPGVSGDIRISPSGIAARDIAGNNTFVLDGETGDAFFAGILQSGTLVTGQVAVGNDAIHIDGENKRIVFYDDNGIPSIVIGEV